MSTLAASPNRSIELGHDPRAILAGLENDQSLFQTGHLRERLIALDDLDAAFGGSEDSTECTDPCLHSRANALRTRLEAANTALYQSLRSLIMRKAQPPALLRWLQDDSSPNESAQPSSGFAFDWRDELVSGVLQLNEPHEPSPQLSPEMVPYQPTPVRHILHLLRAIPFSKGDLFVDLGSGLGHVPLLVSMMTGIRSLGIEVEAAYAVSAQQCAENLNLSRVRFTSQDARLADLSSGTVFYLYSPFRGSILSAVLKALEIESSRRPITICSLGPCTHTIAGETWLKPNQLPNAECVIVFRSH